eukprot:RCo012540
MADLRPPATGPLDDEYLRRHPVSRKYMSPVTSRFAQPEVSPQAWRELVRREHRCQGRDSTEVLLSTYQHCYRRPATLLPILGGTPQPNPLQELETRLGLLELRATMDDQQKSALKTEVQELKQQLDQQQELFRTLQRSPNRRWAGGTAGRASPSAVSTGPVTPAAHGGSGDMRFTKALYGRRVENFRAPRPGRGLAMFGP